MYAALWRALPGPAVLKAVLLLALLGVIVVLCFQWLFPLVASLLPYDETTVDTEAGSAAHSAIRLPQLFSHREDLA